MPVGSAFFRFLALGFAFLTTASAVHADHWERFRGPNGAGISSDKHIPTKFNAKDALWKVAIPGIGNSSPIVWDDRIFLQTASADGKLRTLLCLDTAGKEIWKRSIPGGKAPLHAMSTLASSTPTTDGEAVYIAFWNGKDIIMSAYGFNKGEPLWDRNLGPFVSQHGAGGSPILYKDKLIFANDQDAEDMKSKKPTPNPAKIYAFNKKTGTIAWEMPREAYRACYSVPFVLEQPGMTPELIVTSTTAITSYDPDSGKPNWNWKWSFTVKAPLRTIASTSFHDGTLFACSGDGSGDRHMVAIAMNGAGKDARPSKLWENKREFPYVGCLLTHGDYVYFTNDGGFAGCYHAKTGKKMWYERHPDTKFTASPILIDGKIYACSEDGDVYVFAADPKGYDQIAKNALGELIRATPAVANGRLYVRGKDHLFCIGR